MEARIRCPHCHLLCCDGQYRRGETSVLKSLTGGNIKHGGILSEIDKDLLNQYCIYLGVYHRPGYHGNVSKHHWTVSRWHISVDTQKIACGSWTDLYLSNCLSTDTTLDIAGIQFARMMWTLSPYRLCSLDFFTEQTRGRLDDSDDVSFSCMWTNNVRDFRCFPRHLMQPEPIDVSAMQATGSQTACFKAEFLEIVMSCGMVLCDITTSYSNCDARWPPPFSGR